MENSKENLLNWERKLGTSSMFDLGCLRMDYLERFCSEHLCSSLAMREGKIKYPADLLCMEDWWSQALEKVASNQRTQTAGSATN